MSMSSLRQREPSREELGGASSCTLRIRAAAHSFHAGALLDSPLRGLSAKSRGNHTVWPESRRTEDLECACYG